MDTIETKNSATFEVTLPSDNEIRMSRWFDAPRAAVCEAMTRPEDIREWWGRLGEGYSVPVCECDVRVGGKWRFVNRHPHGEAAFHGEYLELDLPARVVFTEIFEAFPDTVSIVTGEYEETAGRTRMTVTVRYPAKEIRDMVLGSGMARGAGISYDRLEDLLARRQPQ